MRFWRRRRVMPDANVIRSCIRCLRDKKKTLPLNTPGADLKCGRDDHVRQRVSDPTGGVSRVAPPVTTLNNESLTGAVTRPPSFIKIKPTVLRTGCENNEALRVHNSGFVSPRSQGLSPLSSACLYLRMQSSTPWETLAKSLDSTFDSRYSINSCGRVTVMYGLRAIYDGALRSLINRCQVVSCSVRTSGSSAEMQNDQRIRLSGSERAEIPGSPTGTEGSGGSVGTARPFAYEGLLLGHAEGGGIPGGIPPGGCGSGRVIG